MQFEPIIRVNLSKFKDYYGLTDVPDGTAFERYANYTILSSHQPGAFSVSDGVLNRVSVGGSNDMGLDGICIKLNGTLITTKEEADDVLSLNKQAAAIEFIFIQSKYKNEFDSGEYAKFAIGVKDFLSDTHFQPMNEALKEWLKIKDYLLSEEVIDRWIQTPPSVRLYYVVMGEWRQSPHIEAISSQLQVDIKKMDIYQEIFIQYVDAKVFKQICNDNDNYFTCTLNTIDMFQLPEVDKVKDSLVVLFSAPELLRMLDTGEGIIRKALFNDNVRDFQGDTTINEEVYQTLVSDPKSFILLNNGITIICDTMLLSNRKIKITNPQIVNGCQTCNLLYQVHQKGINCDEVTIFAKVIATNDDNNLIVNRIVKSTNRQNIVYDEAFEITKDFHKELEELFQALSIENKEHPLYYERRSKQFANMPVIKVWQKANFTTLIQGFVSIFLDKPHLGHRHPNVLLQLYKNKLFVAEQSKHPYYLSALLYTRIEDKLRNKEQGYDLKAYKSHLAMLFKLMACGQSPDVNKLQLIDEYCKKFSTNILHDTCFENIYLKTVALLHTIIAHWIEMKGQSYQYGIKDSEEFTAFLISEYFSENIGIQKQDDQAIKYRGKVIKTGFDRNGDEYGFISMSPNNIFFHSSDNQNIKVSEILHKEVLYNIHTSMNGKPQAIDLEIAETPKAESNTV